MSGFCAGLGVSFMLLGWALIVFNFNALATVTFLVAITLSLGALAFHKDRPQ